MKRNAGQHGLHVSRHVVGSFNVVNPAGVGWRKAVKRRAEIGADVRIGILLYQERRRGVAGEHKHDSVTCSATGDEIRDVLGNLEKPLARRLEDERRGDHQFGSDGRDRGEPTHRVVPVAAPVPGISN